MHAAATIAKRGATAALAATIGCLFFGAADMSAAGGDTTQAVTGITFAATSGTQARSGATAGTTAATGTQSGTQGDSTMPSVTFSLDNYQPQPAATNSVNGTTAATGTSPATPVFSETPVPSTAPAAPVLTAPATATGTNTAGSAATASAQATATATTTATAATTTTTTTATAATTAAPAEVASSRVTQAKAQQFLANYPGVWEGTSTVQSLDGGFRTEVAVMIEYRWDKENPQILTGRAVFAIGQHTVHATSHTYYENGWLICIIEREGQQLPYSGRINAAGDSITWREMNQADSLKSYSKETFTTATNTKPAQLLIEGYEDYRSQGAVMTQKTVMTRIGD